MRRKEVVGAKRIRSEKLKEDRYKEEYAWSLEGKRVEGDGNNVNEAYVEQVKWHWLHTLEKCVAQCE